MTVSACCNCGWREDSPLPHTGCISAPPELHSYAAKLVERVDNLHDHSFGNARRIDDLSAKLGVTALAVEDMVRRFWKLEDADLLSRVAQIHRECSAWHTHHHHGEDVVRRIEKLEKQMELTKAIDDVITQGTRLLDGVYGGGWEVLRESLRQLIYHRMKGWAPPMTNYVATYSHLSEVSFADYWPKR